MHLRYSIVAQAFAAVASPRFFTSASASALPAAKQQSSLKVVQYGKVMPDGSTTR
jgi:hypothetical protein